MLDAEGITGSIKRSVVQLERGTLRGTTHQPNVRGQNVFSVANTDDQRGSAHPGCNQAIRKLPIHDRHGTGAMDLSQCLSDSLLEVTISVVPLQQRRCLLTES